MSIHVFTNSCVRNVRRITHVHRALVFGARPRTGSKTVRIWLEIEQTLGAMRAEGRAKRKKTKIFSFWKILTTILQSWFATIPSRDLQWCAHIRGPNLQPVPWKMRPVRHQKLVQNSQKSQWHIVRPRLYAIGFSNHWWSHLQILIWEIVEDHARYHFRFFSIVRFEDNWFCEPLFLIIHA